MITIFFPKDWTYTKCIHHLVIANWYGGYFGCSLTRSELGFIFKIVGL